MALNIIETFKDLANDKRAIQDIREAAVSKLFYENPSDFFTYVPGIKGRQQIATIREAEYVTRKDQGAEITDFVDFKNEAMSQEWNPSRCQIAIKTSYVEFEQTLMAWGLANGIQISDIQESDFFNFWIEFIFTAMKQDTHRIALFGDSDIANQDVLSDSNKAGFYDLIDKGLIPTLQYFKTITALENNFIELSKNTGTSQFTLDNDYALNLFNDVTDTIDFEGNILLTNRTLYRNYKNYFKNLGGLESSKEEIQNGIQNARVDGNLITPINNYDRWRKADFKKDDGGGNLVTYLPHFALFTKKEYLQIGVDSLNALEDLSFEFVGGADRHFYVIGNYQMDFKMTNPYEFKAAI